MLDPTKIFNELKDQLFRLDEQREEYHKKVEPFRYFFWTVFILGGAFIIIQINLNKFGFDAGDTPPFVIILYVIVSAIALILFGLVKKKRTAQFKEEFAKQIAPYLIRGLDPSIKYIYDGKIPKSTLQSSGLFDTFETYTCQDLISGTVNDVTIQFAEISLLKMTMVGTTPAPSFQFNGFFYEVNLDISFPANIWIVPKKFQIEKHVRTHSKLKVDHSISKKYVFYTENEEQALSILQTAILDRLSQVNSKLTGNKIAKSDIGFHFGGKQVQVAFQSKRKFMEPKLGRSINTLKFIEEQTILINAVQSLIEDLGS